MKTQLISVFAILLVANDVYPAFSFELGLKGPMAVQSFELQALAPAPNMNPGASASREVRRGRLFPKVRKQATGKLFEGFIQIAIHVIPDAFRNENPIGIHADLYGRLEAHQSLLERGWIQSVDSALPSDPILNLLARRTFRRLVRAVLWGSVNVAIALPRDDESFWRRAEEGSYQLLGEEIRLVNKDNTIGTDEDFDHYLIENGLEDYLALHERFSPAVRRALLREGNLRPVFLQIFPNGDSGFLVGNPAAANTVLEKGGMILIGVADRHSGSYFPLENGAWLEIKGSEPFGHGRILPLADGSSRLISMKQRPILTGA